MRLWSLVVVWENVDINGISMGLISGLLEG